MNEEKSTTASQLEHALYCALTPDVLGVPDVEHLTEFRIGDSVGVKPCLIVLLSVGPVLHI